MMSILIPLLALLALATSSTANGRAQAAVPSQALGWNQPGYSLNRPLYDGQETGWHVKDPKDGCNYVGYGFSGDNKNGYDFRNRGFAQLLDVDVDFYAEFTFKHFQIFEYSKSRTINFTASSVDVAGDEKAQLAEQARDGIDSAHLDAGSKARNDVLANDGKDVEASHQAGTIRDKLSLTSKRFDELKFRLRSKVEIDELLNQKRKLGEAVRFYGYQGGQH